MPPDEEIDFTPDPTDEIDFTADEPDPVEVAPAPTKAESTSAGNAAWADSLGPDERAAALAAAARRGSSEADRARAQYLLQRHVSRSLGTEDTAAPIVGRDMRGLAGVTGAAQGLTLGWADEMRGAARSQAGEGSYEQQRDLARADVETARTQAPAAYGMGELAGSAPLTAIPAASAPGIGSRLAAAAATNAGIGTVAGAGHSDAEGSLAVEDAVAGGVMGGVFGMGGQLVSEGARAGLGAATRYGATADRARVAAVAPGRGGQIEERILREAGTLPGGVEGTAAALRRMGISGTLTTSDDVLAQADRAIQRIDEEQLRPVYDTLDEIAPVDRERLLGRLDALIQRLDADPAPGSEPMERYLRGMVDRFRGSVHEPPPGAFGPSGPPRVPETLTYRGARDLIEPIRQAANFSGPETRAVVQGASRSAYREARQGMDEIAEESLARAFGGGNTGAEEADAAVRAFQQARRDRVTAGFAQRFAEETGNRGASRAIFGLGGQLFAQGSGGAEQSTLGYVGRALAYRAFNSTETGIRATGAELAQRLVQQHPERLGRWAGPLSAAMQRGASAFAAAHMALSSRDPEYRRALETAGEEAAEAAQE